MSLLSKLSIHAWIVENGIKTESGAILDFHTHRYLFDIYRDESKYLCCIKAGQIGFSTMAILKTIWMAKNKNINIGYILPTYDMVEKFVSSKVNRMAQQNPIIQRWTKYKDKIGEKQIGDAYIFYLGSQTDTSAIMLSLDMLVGDEYDKSPQGVMETYDSRLQHSEYGYKWVFSNPTAPEFGVDRFWRRSDKKMWNVVHSCGKRYVLDESCIDYDKAAYICPHCKGEITDEERRMGDWYDQRDRKWTGTLPEDEEWSGWCIPLWIRPEISAKKIKEYKREKSAEYFANFVAGLPYAGTGNKVYASTVSNCLSSKVNDYTQDRVVIGVDTGLPTHYVLANKQGFFHYGKCSDPSTGADPYAEIESLMSRFSGSIIVADQGGDLSGIRILQAKYPGRVFLVWYRADQKGMEIARWGKDNEYGKVVVDRNRAIQLFVDEMTDRRVSFNGTEAEWHEYITHWLNIYRVWEKDDAGMTDKTKGFKWERSGPDHFVHASIYARIGLDRFMETKAEIVGDDMFGDIPIGRMFSDEGISML